MAIAQQTRGSQGFTLLEMVVVVAVLGLLMVGLTAGTRAGLTLWGAERQRIGETAELDAGARILRLLLTGVPQPGSTGSTAAQDTFSGDADHLSFVADLPTGLGTTERADLTLALRHGALALSWARHLHETRLSPPLPPRETDLLPGVAKLTISYWGPAQPGAEAAWQSQWPGPAPPQLVRIRLSFAKGDRRRWPDLIAAPVL
jgi:general secretion pathway protein J